MTDLPIKINLPANWLNAMFRCSENRNLKIKEKPKNKIIGSTFVAVFGQAGNK